MNVNNNWTGTGRATADAKSGTTQAGKEWANIQVACSYYAGKDDDGKAIYKADFISCTGFGVKAKAIANLKKGDMIAIGGKLQSTTVTDEQSGKKYSTISVLVEDVSVLARKKNDGSAEGNPNANHPAPSYASADNSDFEEIADVDDDDDLPFC